MTAQEIIEFLQRKRSVLNRFGVKSIALFGSYVSGQANNNSDIDPVSYTHLTLPTILRV